MTDSKEKNFNPLKPFDITFDEDASMYDNMPYVRDISLCNKESVRTESGNIFKFYTYTFKEPCEIGGE